MQEIKKKTCRIMAMVLASGILASNVGCASTPKNDGDAPEVSKEAITSESEVSGRSIESVKESERVAVTSSSGSEEVDRGKREVDEELQEVKAESEEEFLDNEEDADEENDGLTSTQRNSINMLNYMTVLTQSVNTDNGNQLVLESAYASLVNDMYPNAVTSDTQSYMTSLMDTINEYRMISVKRERLNYIYEQNKAQAMRQAMPDPVGLLSAVASGNPIKSAASVLYMAIDSATSYESASSQADLQFIKDGWELDDAESAQLHESTKDELNYMLNTVRKYDLPGDYALSQEAVEEFVRWSAKPDSQLERKIQWFDSQKVTYQAFGPYWL